MQGQKRHPTSLSVYDGLLKISAELDSSHFSFDSPSLSSLLSLSTNPEVLHLVLKSPHSTAILEALALMFVSSEKVCFFFSFEDRLALRADSFQ